MKIIEFSRYMTNKYEENVFNRNNLNQFETRWFGKPLTNTYRNQDYINYLKKRGTKLITKDLVRNIKNIKVLEPFSDNGKRKFNDEQYNVQKDIYNKNILIDEPYEETQYKNNPQFAINYIKEITNELKIIEVIFL